MRKSLWMIPAVLLSTALVSTAAHADTVTGYVNDPTANSTDFTTGITALGGSVTTFSVDTLTPGALNPTAFSGATLSGTGNLATVTAGNGPADGNVTFTPLSPGEGPSTYTEYIGRTSGSTYTGSLTVSLATPALGAGVFLIDLFNPEVYDDVVTLSAYTGASGTGTLLGTETDAQYNFQDTNLYFMGISSSGDDIGSVVLSYDGIYSGDSIGVGNILVGNGSGATTPTPEPNEQSMLGIGLAGIGLCYWMMRKRTARGLRLRA